MQGILMRTAWNAPDSLCQDKALSNQYTQFEDHTFDVINFRIGVRTSLAT